MLRVMVSEQAKQWIEGKFEEEGLSGAGIEHQKIVSNVLICLVLLLNDHEFENNFTAVPETRIQYNPKNKYTYIEPDISVLDDNGKAYFLFEIQKLNNEYPEARYKEFIQKKLLEPQHQNNILIAKWYGKKLYYHSPVLGDIKQKYSEQELNKLQYSITYGSKKATYTGEDLLSAQSMLHSRRILKETHKRIDKLEQSVDRLDRRVDKLEQSVDRLDQRIGNLEQGMELLLNHFNLKPNEPKDKDILGGLDTYSDMNTPNHDISDYEKFV
ncbi:MAG: biogenesis of lysosome-related organelles complex 1 subunit 2 [Bacteroidia bacterium]|nr:biogenesis of lysosome-related organelles complex 1 subunit 2 [Bacteroidia bacterium]MDW8348539.1 hypothetical protein [Bacteroidia bacterium]